jgi:hypothetical protein
VSGIVVTVGAWLGLWCGGGECGTNFSTMIQLHIM